MTPGKAYGNRLSVVWEMALSIRRRQSFHASGGFKGVHELEFAPGTWFTRPGPEVLCTSAQADRFMAARPDFVVYSQQVPIGYHATVGEQRWVLLKRHVEPQMINKHRVLLEALVELARVVGKADEHG